MLFFHLSSNRYIVPSGSIVEGHFFGSFVALLQRCFFHASINFAARYILKEWLVVVVGACVCVVVVVVVWWLLLSP